MNIDEKYRKTPRKFRFISGTQKEISHKDIATFENKYGVYLPQDFKLFLLENNGVKVVMDHSYEDPNNKNACFQLDTFCELNSILYGYSDEEYDSVNDVINPPKGYLLIAYGVGGHSEILLNLENGSNYGKVFCSYDLSYDSIEFISNNFNEFLNMSYPVQDFEFFDVCEYGDIKRAIEIIKSGYKLPYPNQYLMTMLQMLIESEYNMIEAIKILVEQGENIKGCLYLSSYKRKDYLIDYFTDLGLNIETDK